MVDGDAQIQDGAQLVLDHGAVCGGVGDVEVSQESAPGAGDFDGGGSARHGRGDQVHEYLTGDTPGGQVVLGGAVSVLVRCGGEDDGDIPVGTFPHGL